MPLIGFKVANEQVTWSHLRDVWRAADDLEQIDVGWNFDHFYPIRAESTEPCLEGWTMLAALAEATHRIRLGCMVAAAPYRHPAVLANMVATIDLVSDGRLELGIGAGWHFPEAEAYGLTLPRDLTERFDLFDETLEVVMGLLANERTSFAGRYVTVTDAVLEPKGPQVPPPLTIGGSGRRRTLRAAARWADWWNLPFFAPDEYAECCEVLAGHCEAIGRDPASIRHSTNLVVNDEASVDQLAEEIGRQLAAGIDQPILYLKPPHRIDVLERAASAVATLGIDHR